ncbi:hypothetical protein P6144_01750 [Sphingomonas sp. HITSZ_GF]|uniref:hypothetical protein n=1 Tax=Sphingomonas sp. HITSZ_GF TaxID=3037247 RepID=UPI00240DFD56|nr:hypothetical protein [Sphingomonas sp. HITSZ_GF]MDG2532357.1 hypothetical protein [Sphingomonas sp. HITSZ_GF]
MRLTGLRCSGPAWLFGWVTAVFLPSLLIAFERRGLEGLPGHSWKVADDVGPFAKLLLGGLLMLCFWLATRVRVGPLALWAALGGLAAMALSLALIPAGYSRGFGIGLTGARFDPAILPWYAIGAVAAGCVFALALARCRARR